MRGRDSDEGIKIPSSAPHTNLKGFLKPGPRAGRGAGPGGLDPSPSGTAHSAGCRDRPGTPSEGLCGSARSGLAGDWVVWAWTESGSDLDRRTDRAQNKDILTETRRRTSGKSV